MYGNIAKEDFAYSLMELTERAMGEHYREFLHDLNYDLEDGFLEGLDTLNVDVSFRNAVTSSVQFMVLTRCGIDAREYLDEEDFAGITDFNTSAVLSHLGNAINRVSNEMLLAIGAVIRNTEREIFAKAIENKRKVDYNKNIEFSTLKHESDDLKEEQMMEEMMKSQGVTEELKEQDQLLWVQKVRGIKLQVEEVIREQLIYAK